MILMIPLRMGVTKDLFIKFVTKKMLEYKLNLINHGHILSGVATPKLQLYL